MWSDSSYRGLVERPPERPHPVVRVSRRSRPEGIRRTSVSSLMSREDGCASCCPNRQRKIHQMLPSKPDPAEFGIPAWSQLPGTKAT
jgi:hypothetical protein